MLVTFCLLIWVLVSRGVFSLLKFIKLHNYDGYTIRTGEVYVYYTSVKIQKEKARLK